LKLSAQAYHLNGNPRMKLKVKDMRSFVDNNFGLGTFDKVQRGEQSLSLNQKDFFVLGVDENSEYMTVSATTADAKVLLDILFKLIVETSETIELIFGAKLGTSLASVKEQLPVWTQKIKRQQRQYEKSWVELFMKALIIESFATFQTFNASDLTIKWDTPDFKNDADAAEIADKLASAIQKFKLSNSLTNQEAHRLLFDAGIVKEANYDKYNNDLEQTAKEDAARNLDEMSQRIIEELE
jgi:hypothetical protein